MRSPMSALNEKCECHESEHILKQSDIDKRFEFVRKCRVRTQLKSDSIGKHNDNSTKQYIHSIRWLC